MKHIIWKPQPKQAVFLSRGEYEALYGGAAGGGKSEALMMEALRQVHIPHYKALILRKTLPELSELLEKSLFYYPKIFPGCAYNGSTHTWSFPSGARIVFGSLQRPADRVKYQGRAYDYIAFDELTHFTYDEYSYLFSRNRPNGPGTRCYIRATANPGGIGHGWVKERFISAGPPLSTLRQTVSWRAPDGTIQSKVQTRVFVPASVYDNPALLKNDPGYPARLASLPEAERAALLYGDWDSFQGQVFTEWRNCPDCYSSGHGSHVIDPFPIPASWNLWRSFDFGYARPFSVGWYAVDSDRRLYRIRELYGCTKTPNQGVRWEPARIAREIRTIEREDPNLSGRRIYGVADPSIYDESRGESVAAMMEREGVYFEPGDNKRFAGKMQVHHRLTFDTTGRPMLCVFSTCPHFIRTLPALVYSQTDPEDVDTGGEDHIYDELRYVCMENPIAPLSNPPAEAVPYSPFSQQEPEERRYHWYRKY